MKVLCLLLVVSSALAIPFIPKSGKEWTPESLVNPDELGEFFEGDIMLPLPPRGKNGLLDERYRWTNGVVPLRVQFTVHLFPDLRGAAGVFRLREPHRGLHHLQREDLRDYVGKIGGSQTINYPQWCLDQYGSVQHEMYHALGFHHEQSRFDRDDYVTIMWDNIQSGAEHNFDKYSNTVVGAFGENYDYGSVMHYSAYAFSDNGQKTIVTVDPDAQIGQRVGLSQVDINKLMNMYNC
ncbi:hypothetical protein Pcinc_038108 [Petrolisthes cinctipes]|uniref:Metalloendopeptidase n=1 Tax=Petrolisthes cinctipes TaxID=88211 RepID=A0AAE1EKT3_PETCI|nr:hypothetical protein Pcinc_038108 [Petrolisthes cinctipes]